MNTPAILLLVFNRPDTTARVFEAIRAARPSRLYVAADGPRPDRLGEVERCAEARRVATNVDWSCEVHTFFRTENVGCRLGPSEGITWFFEHEEEGIILEDDCLPHPSFFPYCAELLQRYRDDKRIMAVTGDNFQAEMSLYPYSYYYSIYNHVWGWATWRRAWALFDREMRNYCEFINSNVLAGKSRIDGFESYWKACFSGVNERKIETWDYVWTYSCWANSGLTCTPRVNLVSNIGFRQDGTHTHDPESRLARLPGHEIDHELVGPPIVTANSTFDNYVTRHIFGIQPPPNGIRWFKIRARNAMHRLQRAVRQGGKIS